ncbi:hypothetical protein [Paenibacillus sp. MSJ-34]|uniref:hypothetical protein n=1 Tax=Paenibacillus sp. MSJ-34 TaxID=2841529 RepID=UPI001C109F77|nr:hypothetical protein [Paenibacillus sp. MSJ-34]MBU5443716.1 hypothetical protein [Paenibacillus sp. MSJ-34]
MIFRSRSKEQGKVTKITEFKKQKETASRQQKCSYCKTMAKRLTFYADHDGKVVGLCRECRPRAKRQDLMPL